MPLLSPFAINKTRCPAPCHEREGVCCPAVPVTHTSCLLRHIAIFIHGSAAQYRFSDYTGSHTWWHTPPYLLGVEMSSCGRCLRAPRHTHAYLAHGRALSWSPNGFLFSSHGRRTTHCREEEERAERGGGEVPAAMEKHQRSEVRKRPLLPATRLVHCPRLRATATWSARQMRIDFSTHPVPARTTLDPSHLGRGAFSEGMCVTRPVSPPFCLRFSLRGGWAEVYTTHATIKYLKLVGDLCPEARA